MGWSLGFDSNWNRDIGYGVPAYCDHPGCTAAIDRGLAHVCGGEPYGGEHGCGLFICGDHQHSNTRHSQLCRHCADRRRKQLSPSPEHPDWINHKLTDESWQSWRDANPAEVNRLRGILAESAPAGEDVA